MIRDAHTHTYARTHAQN